MSATTGDAPVKRRRGPQGGRGATRSQSKTSPEAIARLERDTKCVELRKAGLTFQEIAQRLGHASAGHARDRFLVMLREFPSETVEETRRLLRERYESMLRAMLIELDPKYADVICRRYQEHTGTLPTRDGEPHDFIAGSDG